MRLSPSAPLISSSLLSSALLFTACGGGDTDSEGSSDAALPELSAPELGSGDHTPGSVTFTAIVSGENGLNQPRDLAFNPLRPNELWVMSYADDSAVIISDAPSDIRSHQKRIDGYALHFMEQVTALDFGQDETTFGMPGTFGTCGESRNTYNGQAQANDFTGPSLWSSDLSVFAMQDPHGLGSHLDMLHNTPLCMGIAHDKGNRYWTIGGLHRSIDLYDFGLDDGIGNDDHLDGETWRYGEGEIGYEPGVPHHLDLDPSTGMLYIADPANGRIARLDTNSGTEGQMRQSFETPVQMMEGAVIEDFIKDPSLVTQPSGIELYNDMLFVSDHSSGKILAFDLEGNLINYLETGLGAGSVSGMTFGPDGMLYFVDMAGNQVLRIEPNQE